MRNMRVIMVCNSTSKIISPIRSRCFLVRVASPTDEVIVTLLHKVAKKEKLDLPSPLADRIAQNAKGNLRKAILMLECAKNQQYPFVSGQQLVAPDWETFVGDVAMSMIQEQSPARLLVVRGKLYELISHCIPADIILITLVEELIGVVDETMKREIIEIAGEYVINTLMLYILTI